MRAVVQWDGSCVRWCMGCVLRAVVYLGRRRERRLVAVGELGHACVVKRSEIVNLGGLWLEGHGLLEKSETRGLSSRVPRAAPSL